MFLLSVSSATLILCFFIATTGASHDPGYLTGDISVNCGSTETSAALDGREWIGDEHKAISSSLQIKGSSTSSRIHRQSIISADPVPYKTARISYSQFSYAFQLNPGYKLIRLHFSPFLYRGFKRFKDFFTVEAGPFILLRNFSASLTADALGVKYFAKEYSICIKENQPFNIIFSPDQFIQSKIGTYAFINGIEIISMPTHLSYFHSGNLGVQAVGIKSLIHIDNNSALEIIHRQNIKPSDDFVNMFTMGATLPKQLPNKVNNFTWKISVDVGFKYLVRIHFCEIGLMKAETGRVIFQILINEIIVNKNIDLVEERNDNDILWHRDYMVMMQGRKQEGKRHLLISLQSIDEFVDKNGPLKGFQILKLNNPDNSLAIPNPLPPTRDSPSHTLQNILGVFGDRNTIASAAITIVALVNIVVYKLRQVWEQNSMEEEKKPSARAQRLCRRFSLAEIQSATKNFDGSFIIGMGGFGNVYKGLIDNDQETVAIKRLKYSSNQGEHEFWTEIETLSELRHRNLVSLIGYSNEQQEMILVYDYMTGGTLADHLYKKSKDNNISSLSWTQRLNICIGAGRGLDYLHTGHGIIHRDVKASNILLDENFVAKVSDFGLAKPENRSTLQSHVITVVKGTYGYLDPYYVRTGKLTRKSDTYAFGVVLLEILCGRPAVDPRAEEDMRSLTSWARKYISKGELEGIISSNLRGEISPESLKAFVRITQSCLDDEPKKRPTMAQVVLRLEFALELQESSKSQVSNEIGVADFWPSTEEITFSPSIGETVIRRTTSWDVFGKRTKPYTKKYLEVSRPGQNELFNESQDQCAEDCATDVEVAKFDWVTIKDATNGFSQSNMIGIIPGGTFYEGVLPTGQVVAVKWTSRSEYGRNMFKTELSLLSKLQHPNIMKLLGYFNDGEEMLLVYQFMENTSLDAVLFERSYQLPWTLRFKIITGIARGALYLHQDSGLRIIYGYLESRNILLDIEMKPKIAFNFTDNYGIDIDQRFTSFSDFSSTESLSFDQIPFPSDIYSFGVVVLEIVSGRRHSYLSTQDGDLITCAWKLWNEERELDLMDASMGTKFSKEEALRCIHIGLICTQKRPQHRLPLPLVLWALQGTYQDLQLELRLAAQRRKL